jgi:hypothetical protein
MESKAIIFKFRGLLLIPILKRKKEIKGTVLHGKTFILHFRDTSNKDSTNKIISVHFIYSNQFLLSLFLKVQK